MVRARVLVALSMVVLAAVGGPTLARSGTVSTEICDNCFDDDGDTFIDREDQPVCTAPANGAFAGLGDESDAKAALKCQKGIEKAGTKFALAKLGRLGKCVDAAFACIQLKNGDVTCTDKATAACNKQLLAIPADEEKLRAGIAKSCDDTKVPFADVLAVTGLGYVAEEDGTPAFRPCAHTFSSITDVEDCVVTRHQCSVERIVLAAAPRAVEMLTALGHDPATEFPCLVDAVTGSNSNGNGSNLADPATQKSVVKCQAAIVKAAVTFAATGAKIIHKCADDAATCVQKTDSSERDACGQTAAPKCQTAIVKIRQVTLEKLLAGVVKKCGALSVTDVTSSSGIGFGAAATRCAQLPPSNPSPDPRILALQCLAGRHFCEDVQMFERQVPRLREYGDFLDVSFKNAS